MQKRELFKSILQAIGAEKNKNYYFPLF